MKLPSTDELTKHKLLMTASSLRKTISRRRCLWTHPLSPQHQKALYSTTSSPWTSSNYIFFLKTTSPQRC